MDSQEALAASADQNSVPRVAGAFVIAALVGLFLLNKLHVSVSASA